MILSDVFFLYLHVCWFEYCRGVNTADVRVTELVVRPLLRGGIEERVDIDTIFGDLPRFRSLFVLEVKTYSCFLLLRVSGL